MKKTIRTIAFFAVLGMIATSCQKEFNVEPLTSQIGDESPRTMHYTVNDEVYSVEFHSEQERLAYLQMLMAMTKEGYSVTFSYGETVSNSSVSKEVVTYSTSSESDAIAWCDMMAKDGYVVTMTYDLSRQVFICIAVK